MLLRILAEGLVGVLLAGLVSSIVVPAAMSVGLRTGPWLMVAITVPCIAICVVVGERRRRRRKIPESS